MPLESRECPRVPGMPLESRECRLRAPRLGPPHIADTAGSARPPHRPWLPPVSAGRGRAAGRRDATNRFRTPASEHLRSRTPPAPGTAKPSPLLLHPPSTDPARPPGPPHLRLFLVTRPGQGAPQHQALPGGRKQKRATGRQGGRAEHRPPQAPCLSIGGRGGPGGWPPRELHTGPGPGRGLQCPQGGCQSWAVCTSLSSRKHQLEGRPPAWNPAPSLLTYLGPHTSAFSWPRRARQGVCPGRSRASFRLGHWEEMGEADG